MGKTVKTLILVLAASLLLGSWGCSKIPFLKPDEPEPPTKVHFDDILVPSELSIDRDKTFVFETGGFKAGTMYFTGYIEPDSISDFFKTNMPKDGWRLKSVFRHPKTTLLFEKDRKSCIINIIEKLVTTQVEIYVAPLI